MVRKMEALESRQFASPVHKNPNLEQLYKQCEEKTQVISVWLANIDKKGEWLNYYYYYFIMGRGGGGGG